MESIISDFTFDEDPVQNKNKIKALTEVLKQRYQANPYEYFTFLKCHKSSTHTYFLCDATSSVLTKNAIKCMDSYGIITFRTYMCELVYNAIHMFPDISEYTIITKNKLNTAVITFGVFDELDDQNEIVLGKVSTNFDTYTLNKYEIYAIYIGNKVANPDYETINSFVISLQMGSNIPTVKTSYKINPENVKAAMKF
jgi:hypothetical protein